MTVDSEATIVAPRRSPLLNYVALARPGHWFKNVLVLPGAALAAIGPRSLPPGSVIRLSLALVAICLTSSANYVLNEWLDARFDAFHPEKRHRPSVGGKVQARTRRV